MAEACLKQEGNVQDEEESLSGDKFDKKANLSNAEQLDNSSAIKGVELVAQAIDSIIMRVKVTLKNTTFRIEYLPTVEARGLALEVKIGKIIYAGELGSNNQTNQGNMNITSVKKVFFEDVSFNSDEFTFSKDTIDPMQKSSSAM